MPLHPVIYLELAAAAWGLDPADMIGPGCKTRRAGSVIHLARRDAVGVALLNGVTLAAMARLMQLDWTSIYAMKTANPRPS